MAGSLCPFGSPGVTVGHPEEAHPAAPYTGAQRKAWMGTSNAVRSHQRPGDGASPGVCAARRSPRSRRRKTRSVACRASRTVVAAQ
ncbi:protein of unknown function [Streptantibioticus cattleyicolor NRRL 8057 = DSM 46488]|nr:protein of unknown function [Streptantibioticus cattleyicolor NRRL 8057 = DSM 46488]